MEAEEKRAHEEEAARLKLLPRVEQHAIVALHESVAADSGVSKVNRDEARRRVKALKRLLNLDSDSRKG